MSKDLGDSLLTALEVVTGQRQDSHGSPENSFKLIADYWNTYIIQAQKALLIRHGVDPVNYKLLPLLDEKDITNMMILFKVARCQGQRPSRDTYIDIQGYAAIAADKFLPCEDEDE